MTPSDDGKLSEEEVAALLQATVEEESPAARSARGHRVQGYDFHQPSRFSRAALEKLRRLHDDFCALGGTAAASYLRGGVKIQLASMDQMKWEHVVEEAGDSVVAFVLSIEPLGFSGVATLDARFAGACLERMMGGTPESAGASPADLSAVDVAVLRAFLAAFLEPLPPAWERIGKFRFEPGAFVQDLQGISLFAGGEDFFQVSFLVQGGVGSGQIALSVPFEAVRALPADLEEEPAPEAGADEATRAAMRQSIEAVDVEVAVLLGSADIKLARLVRAEPGDVIVLDTRVGEVLNIKVGDRVKLQGFPGILQGKYAARILM